MVYKGTEYPEMSIDEVGIFAPSDTELVLVLEKPLKGFYLKYSLTVSYINPSPISSERPQKFAKTFFASSVSR